MLYVAYGEICLIVASPARLTGMITPHFPRLPVGYVPRSRWPVPGVLPAGGVLPERVLMYRTPDIAWNIRAMRNFAWIPVPRMFHAARMFRVKRSRPSGWLHTGHGAKPPGPVVRERARRRSLSWLRVNLAVRPGVGPAGAAGAGVTSPGEDARCPVRGQSWPSLRPLGGGGAGGVGTRGGSARGGGSAGRVGTRGGGGRRGGGSRGGGGGGGGRGGGWGGPVAAG
jgi:hypothetical protein